MIYKKELKETFILFENSQEEFTYVFINGKFDGAYINSKGSVPYSSTIPFPNYEHLQKMLKQNIDVKIIEE